MFSFSDITDSLPDLSDISDVTTIVGAVIIIVAAAPIIMGFGSEGIVAGSVAASIQSVIGDVSAGSAFAAI